MSISPVQFASIKDFIMPNEAGKKGAPKVKKVYTLKPDSITAQKTCGVGFKVDLPDNTSAYVHPYQINLQNRIGAHKLAKLLNFDISPKIKAISLPPELSRNKTRPTDYIGTIIDWIEGTEFSKLHKYIARSHRSCPQFDTDNLAELYLFWLISQDADFNNRNIIIKEPATTGEPVTLFSIDNEKSGAPIDVFLKKMHHYPQELKTRIAGHPIPPSVALKLQHFVDYKATGALKLSTYYPPMQVDNCYKIAQFVLDTKHIPDETEILAFLTSLKPPTEPSLFQKSKKILEQFFAQKPSAALSPASSSQSLASSQSTKQSAEHTPLIPSQTMLQL